MNHKHGGRNSSTYNIWCNMKARCLNPKNHAYANYGGRGITICAKWRDSFEEFLRDMGERPHGMSIDRYPDNDGNYEPGNCRWASTRDQNRNRRGNRILTVNGVARTMVEWSEILGISKGTIWIRLTKYGWSEQDAVTVPIVRRRRGNHPTTLYHGA